TLAAGTAMAAERVTRNSEGRMATMAINTTRIATRTMRMVSSIGIPFHDPVFPEGSIARSRPDFVKGDRGKFPNHLLVTFHQKRTALESWRKVAWAEVAMGLWARLRTSSFFRFGDSTSTKRFVGQVL